jgi:hypothetical protein
MDSSLTGVEAYLEALPEDRRIALSTVRQTILENLSPGLVETLQYGHIGYVVPHTIYPFGYHCDPKQPLPYLGLASTKSHMALHMFCLYVDEERVAWFQEAYAKSGKKLDMGKACVRFKKLEDLPLEVLGEALRSLPVDRFVAKYDASIPESVKKKRKPLVP